MTAKDGRLDVQNDNGLDLARIDRDSRTHGGCGRRLNPRTPRGRQRALADQQDGGAEVHLLDYGRVVYKRRGTALTALVLVVGCVALYTFTAIPVYQARVRLLIESENPNIVSFQEVVDQNKASNDYYQTQYRILESRALARRTLDSAKLWSHPAFAGPPPKRTIPSPVDWIRGLLNSARKVAPAAPHETRAQAQAIDRLLSNLSVRPVRGSRLVDVVYESSDRELSAQVANALANAHIDQNLEFRFVATKEATDWLARQMAEQRKQVEQGELALQRYREQNDAVSLEERQNIVVQRLADLNAAVTRARTTRIEKEALHRQLRDMQTDRAALDSFPAILGNSFIQQLKTEQADLQRQQAQLGEKLGNRHPEMLKLRSAIQTSEAKLQGEIAKVVQSVRNEFEAAQAQERSLIGSLDQQKAEALALNRRAIEYGALQRDATSSRQLFEGLLQRAKETSVTGELKTSNIRILDLAEAPRRPARPDPVTNMLLAFVGGGVLAIGLSFFFEYLDNRIKSPEELPRELGLPYLGIVPALKSGELEPSPLLGTIEAPMFSEAFRSIRTSVVFSSADERCRTLVVTSTGPGEGKTMTSTNLAIALAQAGQKVLLMDADMRRPKVHEAFDQTPEPGLSNVIVGNAKSSEAVRATGVASLWVMPAGHVPPNPSELLGSRRFSDLLSACEEAFDWIILDTPPVMAVTDACVTAHVASGVLFVVGAEMTSRHAARAALDQLEGAQAHLLGAVLNRVDIDGNGYYYSRYYNAEYKSYYRSTAIN